MRGGDESRRETEKGVTGWGVDVNECKEHDKLTHVFKLVLSVEWI